jgi:uncharacterized protein
MSAKGLPISKLIEAIRQDNLYGVVEALGTGCDIEEADSHGLRGLPLRTACFSGNIAIVNELISRGADINAAGYDGPSMPLRLAMRAGKLAIIRTLLSNGAKVPAGITLPAEILAETGSTEAPLPEPPSFERPAETKSGMPVDAAANELTSIPENDGFDEKISIVTSYDLNSDSLNMDILHFDDNTDTPASAATENSVQNQGRQKNSFWSSG